jgi:hypothetical protein
MACMTHSCPCGHDWFNNNGGGDCPKCGNDSMRIGHHFDEEHFDGENDEEDENE